MNETKRAVLSVKEAKTLEPLRKRKTRSLAADACLKHPKFPATFEGTAAWFAEQSADKQEQYLADHPAAPKPPRAAPVATKPRHGAFMKKALRQAKGECGFPDRLGLVAELADRIMQEWKVPFKNECPRGWRGEKSIKAALDDKLLNGRVKKYISAA